MAKYGIDRMVLKGKSIQQEGGGNKAGQEGKVNRKETYREDIRDGAGERMGETRC